MPRLHPFALLATLARLAALAYADQAVLGSTGDEWPALRAHFGTRFARAEPFAAACFSNASVADEHDMRASGVPVAAASANATADGGCAEVMHDYVDEFARTHVYSGQIQPQWEGCQKTGKMCLLDWKNPHNPAAMQAPHECDLGSISSYYVDVQTPEDVKHAFEFSKEEKIPLVIKNTGHDYKGRSSAPGSLGLWMHNLKNIEYNEAFVPEGCSESVPAVTMGAGVQWGEAYAFAEARNFTLSGGSDLAVGVVGGWLQGGGHGALSNTLGMGVDNVLQFKVVTPDGVYRTVNACQNPDLWFALRGGGGSTFGVVMEATQRAQPQVTLQVTVVQWKNVDSNQSTPLTKELFTILVDNALQWADDGYGAFVWPETVIYLTPKLGKAEAAATMKPLLDFGKRLQKDNVPGATVFQGEFPSWLKFYNTFAGANAAKMGIPLSLASRLVPRDNFASADSRAELVDSFMAAHALVPSFRLLLGPPSSHEGDNTSSVHDAWRTAIFHVTLVATFNYDASPADMAAVYKLTDRAIDYVRRLTPNAAYSNEASIHEPNHEETFWGRHYPELLRIKQKYDPEHLLDCWHCVGWEPTSPRFSCYPSTS